ncbi:glutamate-rich protein 2 isoform X2 [Centruroides vittatus]|uniref:glutamate-rich protein 2 isoform X2 n=1 Tax=Centruroides vittatus TaxID=120091 RepID=UPI00351046F0
MEGANDNFILTANSESKVDFRNATSDDTYNLVEHNGNIPCKINSDVKDGDIWEDAVQDHKFDEDETVTAPIEVLAEFLSAVMSKDYKSALNYCRIILQYEPENKTAKEFLPLIEEKLKLEAKLDENSESENDSDENDSSDYYSSADSGNSNSSCSSCSNSEDDVLAEENTSELCEGLEQFNIQ